MLESKSNALPDLATSHIRVARLELASIGPKPTMFPITPHSLLNYMPNIRLELILFYELVFETNASTIPPIRHILGCGEN